MKTTANSTALLQQIKQAAPKIAVVGSANVDLTVVVRELPQAGETVPGSDLAQLPGGKSANQAVAAALLGAQVRFAGNVGNDAHGDLLCDSLQKAGVDTSLVGRPDTPTGTALIVVDAEAENTIVISAGANSHVTSDFVAEVAEQLYDEAAVVGLCLEVATDAVAAAAKAAKQRGVSVVLNYSPIKEVSEQLFSAVDVLIVNEHELARLLVGLGADLAGSSHYTDAVQWEHAAQLIEDAYGISQLVVTLGAAGSVVVEKTQQGYEVAEIPAVAVSVVDTTGCGDAYLAALLAGLGAELSLVDAAQVAAVVSGYAASSLGAQRSYGTTDQIMQKLAGR